MSRDRALLSMSDLLAEHAVSVRRAAASYEAMLRAQKTHRADRELERATALAIGGLLDRETKTAVGDIYERYRPVEFGI